MKFNISDHDTYSLATVSDAKTKLAIAHISVDIHENKTLPIQVRQLIYTDALLSGCGKYSREEFLNAVNSIGATLSVSISQGTLNITLKSTAEQLSKLIKLAAVMLKQPTFSKSELSRIQKTTINELKEAKEDSRALAEHKLNNHLYVKGDRKYSYDIDQLIKTIPKITTKDLKQLHNEVFHKKWICSVAGNTKTLNLFEEFIIATKKGATSTMKNKVSGPANKSPEMILNNIPSRQNIDFSIGASIPFTLHHQDYIPLTFAVAVLAKWGGFAGRLMSTVREKEGLTYGIYGQLAGFRGDEQGHWRIMTFFAPDKSKQGLESTFREISKLYKKGITEAELKKFKTILDTQQTLLNDSMASLLSDLHAYHCHGFTLEEIKIHKARIKTLTRKQVNDAIKKYLNPKTLTISGAGPIQTVKNDLKKFNKIVA